MARQYSQHTQAAADAKAAMAAEARRKASMAKRIEMGAAAALILIGMIRTVTGFTASASSEKNVEEVQVQVTEARNTLEQKKAAAGDSTMGTVVQVDAIVNSAAEAGTQVCNMQNTLSAYTKQMHQTGTTSLTVEHTQLLEKMRAYFVDAKGTVLGTWCEYGTWKFDSTFDYEGSQAQVVWKCCNDSNGDLLACCIATYDGDMDKFRNSVVYRTVKYADAVAQDEATRVDPEPPDESTPSDTTSSTTSESEPAVTLPTVPDVSEPNTSSDISEPDVIIIDPEPSEPEYTYPEEQWLYGWSTMYQCWGYFNQDGRFLTEEEYQNEVNW